MTKNHSIELHVVHPRNDSELIADVSPKCTGAELLAELLRDAGEGGFLPQSSGGYELVIARTQQTITSSLSLEQAGVIDGDEIAVLSFATGGGPDWSQLGQMMFWSAAAASIFLRAAAPIIVEF
jgi:hypothetical protein